MSNNSKLNIQIKNVLSIVINSTKAKMIVDWFFIASGMYTK
jgi:hypothetical protein